MDTQARRPRPIHLADLCELVIDPGAMKSDVTCEVDQKVRNASRHGLAILHWQNWDPQNREIGMVLGLKSLI